jgi:hypothetical protein
MPQCVLFLADSIVRDAAGLRLSLAGCEAGRAVAVRAGEWLRQQMFSAPGQRPAMCRFFSST